MKGVLERTDPRLIVVVGPCSIHNPDEAMQYARLLKPLADELSDELLILMRVYFEKPRTSVGWEGLIYDPFLDGSHRIDQGLRIGRKLMLEIAELGLPIAIEALDLISPQYLQDLVSWTAIGARTTESPTHRKLASGISSAIGFKNNVDGIFRWRSTAFDQHQQTTVLSASPVRARGGIPHRRQSALPCHSARWKGP